VSADPLAPSTSRLVHVVCVVCGGPGVASLCSADCHRAAVRERADNVRRFRHLRRGGGVVADALTRRNAELTEALLVAATSLRPGVAEACSDRAGT
jgi:hypothetical protein